MGTYMKWIYMVLISTLLLTGCESKLPDPDADSFTDVTKSHYEKMSASVAAGYFRGNGEVSGDAVQQANTETGMPTNGDRYAQMADWYRRNFENGTIQWLPFAIDPKKMRDDKYPIFVNMQCQPYKGDASEARCRESKNDPWIDDYILWRLIPEVANQDIFDRKFECGPWLCFTDKGELVGGVSTGYRSYMQNKCGPGTRFRVTDVHGGYDCLRSDWDKKHYPYETVEPAQPEPEPPSEIEEGVTVMDTQGDALEDNN